MPLSTDDPACAYKAAADTTRVRTSASNFTSAQCSVAWYVPEAPWAALRGRAARAACPCPAWEVPCRACAGLRPVGLQASCHLHHTAIFSLYPGQGKQENRVLSLQLYLLQAWMSVFAKLLMGCSVKHSQPDADYHLGQDRDRLHGGVLQS